MIGSKVKKSSSGQSPLGVHFQCKCFINGTEFLSQNIINLSFSEWVLDLVPRLDLTLLDDGKYFEYFPLQENDLIRIEIARNVDLVPTVLEFNLVDYKVQPLDSNEPRNAMVSISGLLKNSNLFFPVKSRAFRTKSSDQVMQTIAAECGFKTDFRIKCADTMTWLQSSVTNYDMIDYVLKRSFTTERDMNLAYINRYSKFVYTSLNTELKKQSVVKMRHAPERVHDIDNKFDAPENSHTKSKQKEMYFSSFKYNNFAGTTNKMIGYGVEHSYWDLSKLVKKQINYDDHSLTKFSFKEKQNSGKIVKDITYPYASNNHHANFYTALTQNQYVRDNFFNSCLLVSINANEDLNLFDKVFINIPTLVGSKEINEVHSGEYVVGGIYHEVSKGSIYKMIVALFRNGINKSGILKQSDFRLN